MKGLFGHTRRPLLLAFVLLVLAAPGPARGEPSSFEFKVLRNRCTTTGGDFGRGEVLLKVRVVENGSSGANKFTLAAVAEHYKARTDSWRGEYTWDTYKAKFPDDANSYFHTRWFAYDPAHKGKHQIVVLIKVWHNRKVLASKTITSKSC